MTARAVFAGVDVGGRRKGFHLAVVDAGRRVRVERCRSVERCVDRLRTAAPVVVGVDAPDAWAPDGARSRPGEREFVRAGVCGIRYTPDAATARARTDRYFEWIEVGLELWHRLRAERIEAIECFPTASWTAWLGPREGTRAGWTRTGITALTDRGVTGLEAVTGQDSRDAVAAALTARQWWHDRSTTRTFHGMVVPGEHTLEAALA